MIEDLEDHLHLLQHAQRQFRQGTILLTVLGALQHEQYGYQLRQRLEQAGMTLQEGVLYPLLHRLESRGLLQGRATHVGNRTRTIYTLTAEGRTYREILLSEWSCSNVLIETLAFQPTQQENCP